MNPEASKRTRTRVSRAERSAPRLLSVAAVAITAIPACAAQPGGFLPAVFGPPRVILAESYGANPRETATFNHSRFDRLLKAYVDDAGWVDYRVLADHAEELDAYIDALATAPFDRLKRNEKLALLINAYNAFTLRLILDYWHDGSLASIKDIPAARRWSDKRWTLGGTVESLDTIENKRIRPRFKEPRIHFALVCAAIGCPPLRNEAYVGDRLEEQLEAQARYVHRKNTWFRVDPEQRTVYLTALYKWYGSDFEQVAGSVLNFAANYSVTLKRLIDSGVSPHRKWLDYDWTLNDVRNHRPR